MLTGATGNKHYVVTEYGYIPAYSFVSSVTISTVNCRLAVLHHMFKVKCCSK